MPSGLFVLIIAQATSARHDIAITTPGCVDAAIADYPDGPIVVDGSVTVSKLFSLFHLFFFPPPLSLNLLLTPASQISGDIISDDDLAPFLSRVTTIKGSFSMVSFYCRELAQNCSCHRFLQVSRQPPPPRRIRSKSFVRYANAH